MKKNLVIYIPAVLAVLAVKLFYRTADSELLSWILEIGRASGRERV